MPEMLRPYLQRFPTHYIVLLVLFNVLNCCRAGRDQTADIFRNDQARYKNPIWWKAYFAEIMAGSLITFLLILFICWYNCTGRGLGEVTQDANGQYKYGGRFAYYQAKKVEPDEYNVVVNPISSGRKPSFAPCSKPACVCAPGEGGGRGKQSWKSWRKAKQQENEEVYFPPTHI